jgi:hypothetical protein
MAAAPITLQPVTDNHPLTEGKGLLDAPLIKGKGPQWQRRERSSNLVEK